MEGGTTELVVTRPDATLIASIPLTGERVTVGRQPELNDIALEPDPAQYVSRAAHCVLEREGDRWMLMDGGSINGTYLRRGETLERVSRSIVLRDGDVVCVLATIDADGTRRYFELSYRQLDDAQATRAAPVPRIRDTAGCLAYDPEAARLLLVQGSVTNEIHLRPQGHRLVNHMAERNAAADGTSVLCGHEELMRAVWGDEPMHTRLELARLVWELRRELRRLGADDLVESERGRGYRLKTCRS